MNFGDLPLFILLDGGHLFILIFRDSMSAEMRTPLTWQLILNEICRLADEVGLESNRSAGV